MSFLLPLMISFLIGSGVWLLLSRDWLKMIIAISLLGHGVNLFLLLSGRQKDFEVLPQALILTAIVIGLGLQCLLLVFAVRAQEVLKRADVDMMKEDFE